MNEKLAVITGASSGIGKAFAKELAGKYKLLLVARNLDRLNQLKNDLPGEVETLSCDLSDLEELRTLEARLENAKDLALLVNNAGFGTISSFARENRETVSAMIDTNVRALTRLTHAALTPMLKNRSGAIIQLASVAGLIPTPFSAVYGAGKAYVAQFSRDLHEELKDEGVYVQALCPGLTHTEFHARGEIDTGAMPEFMWMSPEQVVAESLAGMKSGKAMVIPGLMNRPIGLLSDFVPDSILAPVVSSIMKRTFS